MQISVRKVTAVFAGVVVALVMLSVASGVAFFGYGIDQILGIRHHQLFHISREATFATWYSAALLLLCALAFAAVGVTWRGRVRTMWWWMAGFLMLLSADEVVSLHERLGNFLLTLTGAQVRWVVPALIGLAAVLFASRAIWRALDRKDLVRFVTAAGVYVVGAASLEVVWLAVRDRVPLGVNLALMHVEETMEMAGLILLLRAVLLVLAANGPLTLDLVGSRSRTPTERSSPVGVRSIRPLSDSMGTGGSPATAPSRN